MSAPSVDELAAMAESRGLSLTGERLEAIAAFFEGLWPRLQELRALELSFLDDVIEPAHADRWIQNGGTTK